PIYIFNFLLVAGYFVWAINGLQKEISMMAWVKYVVLFFCGLSVVYSLRMFFAVLVMLVHNASSLTYVWYQFYRLGTRPHSLYPTWLRAVVVFVVPVGLIVSVPSYHLLF